MPNKHFCVHGHFYQPPREDPLTGEIPQEYGAAPYPNWTEKIYHSCYLPNAQAGNFEKISFNIGSTLTHWMGRTPPGYPAGDRPPGKRGFRQTGRQQRHGPALLPYHHAAFSAARQDHPGALGFARL